MRASQESFIYSETLLMGTRPNGYWTACLGANSDETELARQEAHAKAETAIRQVSCIVGLFGATLEWSDDGEDDE